MSVIDINILRAIGARPTGLRSPIPLYMRERRVTFLTPAGVPASRYVAHDLSYQQTAALLLEISDFSKFRRCVHERDCIVLINVCQ